jgi:hypothetical protein
MKKKKMITLLVLLIAFLSAIAALTGIFSNAGAGQAEYESIRGTTVTIYGKGIYGHMPADVAIQGIAQDWITLLAAIPLLLISLTGFRNSNLKSRFILTGTVGYMFVTYLFYLNMGMYNIMFLVYAALLGLTFFALLYLLLGFDYSGVEPRFPKKSPAKWAGVFLMINALAIGLLWLSIVIPPLIDGSIYPESLYHFTTLVVQGLDIGLLLPIAFVTGYLLKRKTPAGIVTGTVYIMFLSILMTALTAKIIAMALQGVNVVPVVFIIPTFNLITIGLTWKLISGISGAYTDPIKKIQ